MWKPKTIKVGSIEFTIVEEWKDEWGNTCANMRFKNPVGQVRLWKYLIKRFIRWNKETICTG